MKTISTKTIRTALCVSLLSLSSLQAMETYLSTEYVADSAPVQAVASTGWMSALRTKLASVQMPSMSSVSMPEGIKNFGTDLSNFVKGAGNGLVQNGTDLKNWALVKYANIPSQEVIVKNAQEIGSSVVGFCKNAGTSVKNMVPSKEVVVENLKLAYAAASSKSAMCLELAKQHPYITAGVAVAVVAAIPVTMKLRKAYKGAKARAAVRAAVANGEAYLASLEAHTTTK